uniref:EF-hand calcium binding domain 1 n=2 Tax=Nothobranchius TaxID=28779 RepID=A0A1A8E558_NOTKA|nr:calaxin [Nothobranchius furzeri]
MDLTAMNKRRIRELAKTITEKDKHFKKKETESLILEFYELLGQKVKPGTEEHGVDRLKFKVYLHDMFRLSKEKMTDGIFRVFDKDRDGFLSLEEWLKGMTVFLRGTLEEKIKYAFSVYDLNEDGEMSREEMFYFLKDTLPGLPPEENLEEAVKFLVEIPMKRMDTNKDGLVSLEEFEAAVKKENLLLEAFGPCLPDTMTTRKFQQRVFQKRLE